MKKLQSSGKLFSLSIIACEANDNTVNRQEIVWYFSTVLG